MDRYIVVENCFVSDQDPYWYHVWDTLPPCPEYITGTYTKSFARELITYLVKLRATPGRE